MFRNSEIFKRSPSSTWRASSRWRILCVAAVLAFIMGDPGAVWAGQAAAPLPDSALPATLRINIPGHILCANRDYEVFVTPVIGGGEVTDTSGTKHKLVEKREGAVAIEAFAKNTGVATISPARQVSGWDVEGFDVSAAKFALHTKKPGTTRVYFEALLRGQNVGPGVDIQVVACKYKVTMTFHLYFGTPDGVIKSRGYMTTMISGEGEGLSGSGTLKFSTAMESSGCMATAAIKPIDVNIKGHVSEAGDLQLNLDYSPNFEYSTSVYCSAYQQDGSWPPLPTSYVIPITQTTHRGRGQSTDSIAWACLEDGFCALRVTVQPITK